MQDQNSAAFEQQIIQELAVLQPYMASHGGRIDFVKYEQAIVYVSLHGTCNQCPLSFYTVTYGIERHLKAKFSCIQRVEVVEA